MTPIILWFCLKNEVWPVKSITANSYIWRFPNLVGTPKSSISRWIFHEHVYKPSNKLGDPPWLWKPMNQWIWWWRDLYLLRGGVLLVILTAFHGHILSRMLVAGILTCVIIRYTCLLDYKLRYLGTCLELAKHFIFYYGTWVKNNPFTARRVV